MARHHCLPSACASPALTATMRLSRSDLLHAPDRPQSYVHPARLILILSLAPTVGLGIGRFAYSLVLPDMRDALGWSYSAAGFMNTLNAAGYLAGALMASRLVQRYGLSAAVRVVRQFCRSEFCAAARRAGRGGRIRRQRRAGGDHCAIAADAGELPAESVLRRARARYPVVRPDRALRAAG